MFNETNNKMEIVRTITNEKTGYSHYEVTNGKKTVFIITAPTYVNVCVNNTAHKVWKGIGRLFNNFEEAIKGYKDKDIISMINFVKNEN